MQKKSISNLEFSYRYLYPRLTVMVSSGSVEKPNALTIAWSTPLSVDPPLCGIMITKKRFSHEIISRNKEFVINIPDFSLVKGCFHIGSVSGNIEPNKIQNAGFTVEKSEKVNAPRIKECKINIECKLEKIVTTGDHDLFVGKVVHVVIDSKIVDEWSFDLNLFQPVYWRQSKELKETFQLNI
ncbi:MAG: flavin reductase family protein [Candidatus Hodarchaeales archaeon]